jgi:hypothetical protein
MLWLKYSHLSLPKKCESRSHECQAKVWIGQTAKLKTTPRFAAVARGERSGGICLFVSGKRLQRSSTTDLLQPGHKYSASHARCNQSAQCDRVPLGALANDVDGRRAANVRSISRSPQIACQNSRKYRGNRFGSIFRKYWVKSERNLG